MFNIKLFAFSIFLTLNSPSFAKEQDSSVVGLSITGHQNQSKGRKSHYKASISSEHVLTLIYQYKIDDSNSIIALSDCNIAPNIGYTWNPRVLDSNLRFNMGLYTGPNYKVWEKNSSEYANRKSPKNKKQGKIGGERIGSSDWLVWPIVGVTYEFNVGKGFGIKTSVTPVNYSLFATYSF